MNMLFEIKMTFIQEIHFFECVLVIILSIHKEKINCPSHAKNSQVTSPQEMDLL